MRAWPERKPVERAIDHCGSKIFPGARQLVRPGGGRAAHSAGRGCLRPPGLAHQLASARKFLAHGPRVVIEHRSCRVRCADFDGRTWKSRCCEPRWDGPHSGPDRISPIRAQEPIFSPSPIRWEREEIPGATASYGFFNGIGPKRGACRDECGLRAIRGAPSTAPARGAGHRGSERSAFLLIPRDPFPSVVTLARPGRSFACPTPVNCLVETRRSGYVSR
jgi:hypothetical protein